MSRGIPRTMLGWPGPSSPKDSLVTLGIRVRGSNLGPEVEHTAEKQKRSSTVRGEYSHPTAISYKLTLHCDL